MPQHHLVKMIELPAGKVRWPLQSTLGFMIFAVTVHPQENATICMSPSMLAESASRVWQADGCTLSNPSQGEFTQIGDDHARCCTVAGTSAGRSTPASLASAVVQRQLGFSNTRM